MEDLAMVASVCSEITVILGALALLLTLAALEAAMLEMIMGGAV